MRLTESQRSIVREEVARAFGEAASVRLFGSRIDDHARGGDIDLHIEADAPSSDQLLERELRLRARLWRRLGDRRIDIVVLPRGRAPRPIDEHARRTGVPL